MAKAGFINKSKFTSEDDDGSHDYEIPQASDLVSIPTNMIPGLSGVSGGRVLLGDKAVLQAISIKHREAPLVRPTDDHSKDSFNARLGKEMVAVHAKNDGVVTKVTPDAIHIGDEEHELYNYHQLGRKTALHHTPVVKEGDKVKKGTLLATSNFSDAKGNLALGANLRTAVMPYRGANFEDAFVVTESGAKKLAAEQVLRYRIDTRFGTETSKNKYASLFPNKYTNSQLDALDADGVVKEGHIVHHGDPIVLAYSPRTLKTQDINLGKISKSLKNAYSDSTHVWDHEHPGKVVRVNKTRDVVTLQIATERPLQESDKVSNFFGAKGVVRLIKDTEAPTDKDGKPVDVILNSMSITSRVAPSLLNVLAMGKVAQKLGRPLKITPFVKGSSVEHTIALLKKHGVSEQEELYDPVSGNHLTASVGPLFVNRLVHISEDKVSHRGHGRAYSLDMQPAKVEDDAAKRVGNLMTTALLSHGANAVLRDIALVKATKNDDYWRAVKLGLPPPTPQAPFIYDKFLATLRGAGVNVKRQGSVSTILPQTDKDVEALSAGAIHEPTTFKVKDNELIPEDGGLFDASKVGIVGNKFNHIELPNAIPNPISEDYLRKLLGVTQKQYDEGIISGSIAERVKGLSIDAEIKKQQDYLKSGKVTNRDNAYKLLRFLLNLKQHDIELKDLLLTKIPVIPARFRPISQMGDMTFSADVNHLYKELLLNNKALKKSAGLPPEKINALKEAQYSAVKAIYGLETSTNAKLVEKNVSGLLSSMLGIQGHRGKHSTFQAKVVNKPVDLVGRAVIVPDATLGLDQLSAPESTLWKMYAPFIIGNLVKRGVAATKAQEYVTNKHPLAEQALHEELQTRPAVVTRDPQLHKYSAQAFYLKPNSNNKDHSLKMNPLIYKGMGADNDGDQLNINVPASDDARKEVIEKMLPSKNLLGPASFAPMYVPSNEASLGLFQLSTEDKKNEPKHYKTEADVVRAFEKGELMPGDNVKIG